MKAKITKMSSGGYKWQVGHLYSFAQTKRGAIRAAKRQSLKYGKDRIEEIDLDKQRVMFASISFEDLVFKSILAAIVVMFGLLLFKASNTPIDNSKVVPVVSPTPTISKSATVAPSPTPTPTTTNKSKSSDNGSFHILPIPGGIKIGSGLSLFYW